MKLSSQEGKVSEKADVKRLARSTDPFTSVLAAESIEASGNRRRQKALVYVALCEFLKAHGRGATSAELASFRNWSRYMPARRLPDLESDGLVRRGDARRCEARGTTAIEWQPV